MKFTQHQQTSQEIRAERHDRYLALPPRGRIDSYRSQAGDLLIRLLPLLCLGLALETFHRLVVAG